MRSIITRGFNSLARLLNKTQVVPDRIYVKAYKDYDKFDKSARSTDALISTMNRGLGILDDLGVSYSVGRGTILGYHRDGKFLPGEIDIDIDIFGDDKVYEIIQKMPFEIFLISQSDGRYQQLAFLDPETNVIFDIWFYRLVNDKYVNRNVYGVFRLPKQNVEDLSTLSIEGKDYTSLEPEWFCEYWYGKNWKTPQSYGKDWFIDYKRDCSGFNYMGSLNVQYYNFF